MRSIMFKSIIAGVLLAGVVADAASVSAELKMKGKSGRKMTGQIVSRDGDMIEFATGTSARAIKFGIDSIEVIKFKIKIDNNSLYKMMEDRDFEGVIEELGGALEPFEAYSDIPSNLASYNLKLLEVYYLAEMFEESLKISSVLSQDDREEWIQKKSQMYQALALIELEKLEEVKALLESFGWKIDDVSEATPDQLFVFSKLMSLEKKPTDALEMVARIVALHSQDQDWIRPAEMLCAELYTELKLYQSAEEVCRQILMLYKDTPEYDQAELLKIKIEELREQDELEKSLETEDA